MQLNLIDQQDTRSFQRILPVGVRLRQATSKIQDYGEQVTVTITQLLKLKDLRRPIGGSERHFEARRAVIKEDPLNMLQCLGEGSTYSPKVGKLEGPVIAYLQPLAQFAILTQIEPLAHSLIICTGVECTLEGVMALQLRLKNISHLRHLREVAIGTIIGHHWQWDQCLWVGVADLMPECIEVGDAGCPCDWEVKL